jgi:hypothetical protein
MATPSLPRLQPTPCPSPLHRGLRASSVWQPQSAPSDLPGGRPVASAAVSGLTPSPAALRASDPSPAGRTAAWPPPAPAITPSHRVQPQLVTPRPARSGARCRSQAAAAPAQAPRDQGKGRWPHVHLDRHAKQSTTRHFVTEQQKLLPNLGHLTLPKLTSLLQ